MTGEQKYNQYFRSLLEGNKVICSKVLNDLIAEDKQIKEIYEDLFRRSLYRVGELWELNKISVATEHMATAITENMMITLQPRIFNTERTGRKAVIACVANEYHQVGAKMIADIFEMHGWDGYFIGANTPVQELLRFIEEKQPDMAGLSLSIYFNINVLRETLHHIQRDFPDLPVVVGGQAFRWGGKELAAEFNKVQILESIDMLESYITRFNSNKD